MGILILSFNLGFLSMWAVALYLAYRYDKLRNEAVDRGCAELSDDGRVFKWKEADDDGG